MDVVWYDLSIGRGVFWNCIIHPWILTMSLDCHPISLDRAFSSCIASLAPKIAMLYTQCFASRLILHETTSKNNPSQLYGVQTTENVSDIRWRKALSTRYSYPKKNWGWNQYLVYDDSCTNVPLPPSCGTIILVTRTLGAFGSSSIWVAGPPPCTF